jgi:hypothetical protein
MAVAAAYGEAVAAEAAEDAAAAAADGEAAAADGDEVPAEVSSCRMCCYIFLMECVSSSATAAMPWAVRPTAAVTAGTARENSWCACRMQGTAISC